MIQVKLIETFTKYTSRPAKKKNSESDSVQVRINRKYLVRNNSSDLNFRFPKLRALTKLN